MERNIQIVYLALKRLKVAAFSAAESRVGMNVVFNDGKDRALACKLRIAEPKIMAVKLISELMAVEENEHTEFDGEALSNNTIVLLYDKEKTQAALTDFFQTLYSKACRIKNATKSDGYLNMVADLRRTELVL